MHYSFVNNLHVVGILRFESNMTGWGLFPGHIRTVNDGLSASKVLTPINIALFNARNSCVYFILSMPLKRKRFRAIPAIEPSIDCAYVNVTFGYSLIFDDVDAIIFFCGQVVVLFVHG